MRIYETTLTGYGVFCLGCRSRVLYGEGFLCLFPFSVCERPICVVHLLRDVILSDYTSAFWCSTPLAPQSGLIWLRGYFFY